MPAIQEANLVGKRQDISNVLVIANAAETPLFTMIKKGVRPGNTLLEYPIDKYDDPVTGGVPDGQDADTFEDAQKDRKILYSRVQKWRRTPMVTELAQETDQAGDGGNKFAQAKAKKLVELKQDIEATLLGTQDSVAGSGATASVTRGLGSWIATSAQSDTATAVPSEYRPASGQLYASALSAFTESSLRDLLQARWEQMRRSGDLHGFCGSAVKAAISDFGRYDVDKSGFTQVRQFNGEMSKLASVVEIYVGDFGTVTLHLDAFVPTTKTAYLVDMNMLEFRAITSPVSKDLPDGDGGPRAVVKAIGALCNLNPQAHIKIVAS